MSIIGKIRRLKRIFILDPVKQCDLYKNNSCSFVDGPLCDFPKCSMRHDFMKTAHLTNGEVDECNPHITPFTWFENIK